MESGVYGTSLADPCRRESDTSRWLSLVVLLTIPGCATTFSPTPLEDVPFLTRAETQTRGGVTVTAAVPTHDESNAIYGVDLASKGIQPIWLEVKNEEDSPYWFLPSGLDPAYFSASESAYAFDSSSSAGDGDSVAAHFRSLEFKSPILPGSTVSGFLLVNRDEGYKALDVDLINVEDAKRCT